MIWQTGTNRICRSHKKRDSIRLMTCPCKHWMVRFTWVHLTFLRAKPTIQQWRGPPLHEPAYIVFSIKNWLNGLVCRLSTGDNKWDKTILIIINNSIDTKKLFTKELITCSPQRRQLFLSLDKQEKILDKQMMVFAWMN